MTEKTKNQINGSTGAGVVTQQQQLPTSATTVTTNNSASTQMLEKFRRVEDLIEDDEAECPLCMEPLDIDDIDFFPCSCGYQVCRFCWHRLKDEESGLCPACRQTYPELPVRFSTISIERVEEIKKEKRKQKEKSKLKDNNKMANLATIRVVQKNLLFVIGFSARISQDDLRKEFLKYGKIIKMVINPSSAYVTYTRAEDAVMAIKALNESNMINGKCNNGGGPKGTGQTIRASLGTTKYCSHWLRSQACPKQPDCMYLHENADQDASFTKEQMQLGKHTEYEKRLIAHYTELLRKKEERALNAANEKCILRTASGLDCSKDPTLSESIAAESNQLKKKEISSANSNDKKSSAIKISKSNRADDEDSDESSSSGNSSLSSSPAANDVGSTFAAYCPSSGVSSLNLCENTSDSLISSSSSGNSSKSSTPDNVQQQAKQQQNQQQNNHQECSVQNGNNHQSDMDDCFDMKKTSPVVSGLSDMLDDKLDNNDDDDDLDFDPIRFTLDDMLRSMSMENKMQQNNTSPQSRMPNTFNFSSGQQQQPPNNNHFMSSAFGSSMNSFENNFSSYRMQQQQQQNNSLFGNSPTQSPSLNRLFESANRQQQQNPSMDQRESSMFSSMNGNSSSKIHERDLNSFLFNQDSNSNDSFDMHRQRLFQQQMKSNIGGVHSQEQQNSLRNLRNLLPTVNINFTHQGCDESSFGFGDLSQQRQQHQHNLPSLSPTTLAAANSFFGPNSMRQNSFSSNSMGSMMTAQYQYQQQQQQMMQRYQQQQQHQRNSSLMAMGGGNANGSGFGMNQRQQAPPGF